jgi:RNase PH-related exoribonuclease
VILLADLSTVEEFVPIQQKELLALLSTGVREDGRKFDEYRKVEIQTSIYEKANGSAMVKIGNTVAVAGVKAELGEPFPDTPNEGVLTVSLELLPHASPSFEPGPPDENAVEMSRIVDRGLRESKAIKTSDLCVLPGKKVWVIYVDIYAMDHDGNIVDASGIAALAALLTAKIPEVKVEGEDVVLLEGTRGIPMVERPVPVTVAKIGDYLVVDPSLSEENVADVRVTMTTLESGIVSSIQKSGSGTLEEPDVLKIYDLAYEKGKEIRSLLAKLG